MTIRAPVFQPISSALNLVQYGPCSFSVRRFTDACAAWHVSPTWRQGIVNVLRTWADTIEGQRPFYIVAHGPASLTWDDVCDAVTTGINGANRHLNDIWESRQPAKPEIVILGQAYPAIPPSRREVD